MDSKILSEIGWKGIVGKFKIKDNGLQKALAEYQKIEEDEHDDLLEAINQLKNLATILRKSREVAAESTVAKYLGDMLLAVQNEQCEITKARGEAQKARVAADKAKAESEKAEAKAEKAEAEVRKMTGREDEGDGEQGGYADKLRAALQKLKGAKDTSYQFIVCEAKPHCGVMIAKQISAKHREELTKVTGGKRFLKVGTCKFEDGNYVFSMEEPVSGLARKLQASIKNLTGKAYPITAGDRGRR
jgi:hypothetical protein